MPKKAIPQVRRYGDGQVIEYTSFAMGGYSVCQVVRYAALDEQDDPANPLVYIRTRVGEKPFRVRESQLRAPRYTARFTPEAWVNDQAVEADPEGPQEWDCTEHARRNRDYLTRLEACSESLDGPEGAVDNDDVFKDDPAAPTWVRGWRGPFTIRISRKLAEEDAVPGIFEDILAAGAAAVEAQDAAEEATARHAGARCRVAALIASSLLPAAATVVFDRDEDTVTAETEITVVNIRDSDGCLLWYNRHRVRRAPGRQEHGRAAGPVPRRPRQHAEPAPDRLRRAPRPLRDCRRGHHAVRQPARPASPLPAITSPCPGGFSQTVTERISSTADEHDERSGNDDTGVCVPANCGRDDPGSPRGDRGSRA